MTNSPTHLVIGGSGLIGSHLVEMLATEGASVRVLGRSRDRFRENLGHVTGVEFFCGDATDAQDIATSLHGIEELVYLASASVPATSMDDLLGDLQANARPLLGVLDAVRSHGRIRSFSYLSSGGTVYGNQPTMTPISEEQATWPISGYGVSKLTAEHYVRLRLAGTMTRSWILRASNVFGPRQRLDRPQGAVGFFLRSLIDDRPITLYGNGSIVRDYVHAQDVAHAIRLCHRDQTLARGASRVFNVGSSCATSLNDLIETIQRVSGRTLQVTHEPARGFDCQYNVLDTTAIRQELGWNCTIPLESGVRETWRWMQAKVGHSAEATRRAA